MNNQKRGRRGAADAEARAGWEINNAAMGLTRPTMVPQNLKSPKARKKRSIMELTDQEIDAILAEDEHV